MTPVTPKSKGKKGAKVTSGDGVSTRDWKSFFKRPLVLVLAISLAIHVLVLLAFGSVAIFKGSVPKLPFLSQDIAAEAEPEVAPPPPDETPMQEEMVEVDPFAPPLPAEAAGEDSAANVDLVSVVGGPTWAPTAPRSGPVAETGSLGGTGKGQGVGSGTAKGSGPPLATKQLFGITLKARKLGVVVSINKGAQTSGRLPAIFQEIFKEFPDSPVFLTNGGGMRDWEVVEKEYKQRVDENNQRKKAGQPYDKFLGKEIKKPEVGRFNTGAALDWVVVRGFEPDPEYVGLKAKHPDLFDDLRRRPGVWFISSNKEADGAYLAFEELMKKGVEGIYWYNQFDRPIEGEVAEGLAQRLTEKKVEILVQNQGKRVEGMDWLKRVEAKFVK